MNENRTNKINNKNKTRRNPSIPRKNKPGPDQSLMREKQTTADPAKTKFE